MSIRAIVALVTILSVHASLYGASTGSVAGLVKDPSGDLIEKAVLTITNTDMEISRQSQTDERGFYSFSALSVGRYDLKIEYPGFNLQTVPGLIVHANGALQVNVTLQMGEKSQSITVSEESGGNENTNTQLGEAVTGNAMRAVALNGRSFTDLLALQPGIVPITTQQPNSIVMAGASVAIPPSGDLNPGNQSISGQREDANGFIINGGDVKELMNGGVSIIPNLDSISEFRVLTGNFDAEYGNYSGGIVNVVTRSGGNALHGSAFEFLRNTALDARDFLSPVRDTYRQNQFGATIGGPILKNRLFFFGDYQGTRTTEGVDTGLISVPSLAERSGVLSSVADSLTGTVSGPYAASLLSQKLGYPVRSNEPYYAAGCTLIAACVFPNAIIPARAWSEPAKHLLQYIPLPNAASSTFSSASESKIERDDKGSFRIDGDTERAGLFSAYYYFDDYNLDNPYPAGQGGATVPGFGAITLGRAQLVSLSNIKTFGPAAVNELHLSYMRSSNNVGQPSAGVGPSLASQGFVTGVGTPGIVPLDPSIEGIENVIFNSFVMGTPITNLKQANNTYAAADTFSRIVGAHTLKSGLSVSIEQVNVNPNPTFNGSFLFSGSETGSDFADFLIGVASNYNQADSQAYYPRHRYAGAFLQDSWRARPNLTLNFGLRWDLMEYWSEKYNQIPTFIPNEQSQVYPTAPTGIVYPGDKDVPDTLAPARSRFSPRFGLAFSPSQSNGTLGKLIGGAGSTSIRAGFGIFYSVVQGNTIAFDEPQPPYGLSYTSPGPPIFATPFITAVNGAFNGNPFPLTFPRLGGHTPASPDSSIDFSQFEPIAGMTAPIGVNTFPYTENYFVSVSRKFRGDTLLDLSYAGSETHHLLAVYSANPGNPALCLALSRPDAVVSGTPACGPFGEDTTYLTAAGTLVNGTRGPLGPAFSNDDYEASIANSNYNSFQATVRHSGDRFSVLAGYTFSKSIDQASSLSDPLNPFAYRASRALSAFDLKHNFVASFEYRLPFDRLFSQARRLTEGWEVSGITRLSSGFPVTIREDGDLSLQGSIPNGVNNFSVDLPNYLSGNLNLNHDPRNGHGYFDTALFQPQSLGTQGNASRRSFYGPGMFNTDLALLNSFHLTEAKSLQFRLETFNVFNHAQFFGAAAVNGDISSPLFGRIVQSAPPRLVQIAIKFTF